MVVSRRLWMCVVSLGFACVIAACATDAGAHRMLGAILREVGQMDLAEQELATAIDVAHTAECLIEEADASREMGRLYWMSGRRESALVSLRHARDLFLCIDAPTDVAEVDELLAIIAAPSAAAPTDISGHAAA